MANTTVTITQLPPIGNAFTPSSILPVVQTTGIVSTDQASLGNLGNYILTQAGANLQPAYVANFAYAVTNAAQPMITSVGTLSVNTLRISGGVNGQFLQTNGNGLLNWAIPAGGTVTNYPGGANSQLQFNLNGSFGGNANLTWVNGNIVTTGIKTDGYFFANGVPFNGGSGSTGNIAFSGTTMSGPTGSADNYSVYIKPSGDFINTLQILPTADNDIHLFEATGNAITLGSYGESQVSVNGPGSPNANITIQSNNNTWTFGGDGNTTFPSGALVTNIANYGPGLSTGIFDADGITVGTAGGNDISITPEDGIGIYSNNYQWLFGIDGNLTLPNNTFAVNYANGTQVSIGGGGAAGNAGDIQINVAGNIGADSTLRYVDNGGEMTLYADYLNAPGIFTSDIYAGDGTPSNITLTTNYGNATWTFDTDGNLKLPGVLLAQASDNGSIVFSNNGVDNNGSLKVDAGFNMTINANSNFYVKQNSSDRLAITNTNTDLMASSNVNIHANKAGLESVWTFGVTGNLTIPGDINLPLVAKLNSGGVGVTNSAEFGTDVTVDGSNVINGSSIYMGAGTAESRAIVNSTGNSLMYTGVENPGFAGTVAVDPGVTSEYAIQVGANGQIEIGAVVGAITTTEYVAGMGVLNATGNINGIFANANVAVIGAGDQGWTFNANGNLTIPGGGAVWTLGTSTSGLTANFADPYKVNLGLDYASNTATLTGANSVYIQSNTNQWAFSTDGSLTLPNGAVIKDTAGNSVAVGAGAGANQGNQSVAIGENAGANQGSTAVAIGQNAGGGVTYQNDDAVAIGHSAGEDGQGTQAIAIGLYTGQVAQGLNSIALGAYAGVTSQGNNSIILNATGVALDQTTANTFTVAPVRNDVANISEVMFYNTTSKEVTYGNSISIAGNINAGNIITGTGTTGNITGANVIAANTFQSTVVAFNQLPSASTPGLRAFINNGNLAAVGNFGVQVGDGGANYVPVFSDGANWCIG